MVEWKGKMQVPSLHLAAEAAEVLKRRAGGELQWEIPSGFKEKAPSLQPFPMGMVQP